MNIVKSPKLKIDLLGFCKTSTRSKITASVTAKEITRNLARVKSSNVWARTINVKNYSDKVGDVYVQFKGDRGGPGDIYVYFDVPVIIYRRWLSAPSVGHYFWQYIRGKYTFAKLTGDKRTKQKGGVNSTPIREQEDDQNEQ